MSEAERAPTGSHDDLDAVARRAVAALDADAPTADETDAALDAVRRGVGRPVSVAPARRPSRRPWRAIALGGLGAAAAVAALVVVPRIGEDASPATPLDTSAAPDVPPPAEPPEVSPPPTIALPVATRPTSQTEVPYHPASMETITAVRTVALSQPMVLWSTTFGDGPDQLGLDGCEECDPPRPFRPVVTADRVVVVVDPVNARVVAVDDGTPTEAALPDGFLAESVALGRDGLLYVAGHTGTGQPGALGWVLAYDPAQLGAPVQIPIEQPVLLWSGSLQPRHDGLSLDGGETTAIPYVGTAITTMPDATIQARDDNDGGDDHAVVLSGDRMGPMVIRFPEGWHAEGLPQALPATGQVAATMTDPDGNAMIAVVYAELDAVAMPLPRAWSYDDQLFVDERGIVVLERTDAGFDVVRYPLPI